jgi:hypothetical protein
MKLELCERMEDVIVKYVLVINVVIQIIVHNKHGGNIHNEGNI